jgi:hypothetical protein
LRYLVFSNEADHGEEGVGIGGITGGLVWFGPRP